MRADERGIDWSIRRHWKRHTTTSWWKPVIQNCMQHPSKIKLIYRQIACSLVFIVCETLICFPRYVIHMLRPPITACVGGCHVIQLVGRLVEWKCVCIVDSEMGTWIICCPWLTRPPQLNTQLLLGRQMERLFLKPILWWLNYSNISRLGTHLLQGCSACVLYPK